MPRPIMPFRLFLCSAVIVILAGCSAHKLHYQSVESTYRSYIDLQDGWRIRVVTPILKSGKFKPQLQEIKNEDGTLSVLHQR